MRCSDTRSRKASSRKPTRMNGTCSPLSIWLVASLSTTIWKNRKTSRIWRKLRAKISRSRRMKSATQTRESAM